VDDVTGWCILAYIVVLIHAAHAATALWITLCGIAGFVLIMVFGVKYLVRGFESAYRREGMLGENLVTLMLLLILGSALCTERLGIHPLFGAFLMGAIMPKEDRFVSYVAGRFHAIVLMLLPLFFACTGLRTSISLVKGPEMWMYCVLIILVATAGKLGGSTIAGWISGMPLREALGLGALINTRGMMELVILNIGLEIKVISPALFSMMVMMALVTTFMTTPLLEWVYLKKQMQAEKQPAGERQSVYRGGSAAF
jgi:Kef-type K+ transport system membrane component KefB